MANMYDVGTKAWQPDQTEGWVASEVTKKQVNGDKVTLVFTFENGEVRLTRRAICYVETRSILTDSCRLKASTRPLPRCRKMLFIRRYRP